MFVQQDQCFPTFKGREAPDNKIVPHIKVMLHFLAKHFVYFQFFGEHFKTACGALVVPGAHVDVDSKIW